MTLDKAEYENLLKENASLKRRVERMTKEISYISNMYSQAASTRDYSEREKQLQYEYNYLFLENSQGIIFVLNSDMRYKIGTRVLVEFLGFRNADNLVDAHFSEIFADRMPRGWVEETHKKFIEVMNARTPLDYNEEISLPEGDRVFNMLISPAVNSKGDVMGIICQMHDNTELVRTKEMAEAATKAKTSFLASMSHEIRTPMNAINGLIDLLARTSLTAQQNAYITNVKSATVSLLQIINDVLDFSKIEANRYEIVDAEYESSAAIRDICNLMQPKTEEKGLYFIVDIAPGTPSSMRGDSLRINQVLINIINNAIKFTHQGGIRLDAHCSFEPGDTCLLTFRISDTGQGIREDELDKIFKAFEQADHYKNRNISGTGLGLAISKNLVELMGGTIEVESEYGSGSAFTVKIPQKIVSRRPLAKVEQPETKRLLLFAETEEKARVISGMLRNLAVNPDIACSEADFTRRLGENDYTHVLLSSPEDPRIIESNENRLQNCVVGSIKSLSAYASLKFPDNVSILFRPVMVTAFADFLNGKAAVSAEQKHSDDGFDKYRFPGLKALIVDDNAINLIVASEIIKTYDIEPDEASSGGEALDMVLAAGYDIVFMDHMMPGMDGIEATAAIRALPVPKRPVIIALTANAILGMEKMYLDNGFDGYLTKPLSVSALNEIMLKWFPGEMRPGVR